MSLLYNIKTISFVGAGNVATQLARALHEAGFIIGNIFSKTHAAAARLAETVEGRACPRLEDVWQGSQLVIVAVPDQAVAALLIDSRVPDNVIIVHTCGALEMNVFSGKAAHYGVLYPLQTFSQEIAVEMKNVPFCIEASDTDSLEELRQVASAISVTVEEINSDRRKILHLAAVFACNFPNVLYAIADEVLRDVDLPFRLLHPIMLETSRKATLFPPRDVQTGPARRNDVATLRAHEGMLNDHESYKEIYAMLSKAIQAQYLAGNDRLMNSQNE